MPRNSEVDEIAAAIADRIGRTRSSNRVSESRISERRIASAVAYRLSGGRGRGTAALARSPESRISSAVAFRLRLRPISRPAASLSRSSSSGRSVTRVASVIADSLAQQKEVRPRARFSVDAVASAIARRLRYSASTGTFPVAAVASAVARNLRIGGGLRGSAALASSVVARLSRLGVKPGGGLTPYEEQDPRRSGRQ